MQKTLDVLGDDNDRFHGISVDVYGILEKSRGAFDVDLFLEPLRPIRERPFLHRTSGAILLYWESFDTHKVPGRFERRPAP